MQEPAAVLRCSNGASCVAYPTLGEPAKLSRSNPGPRCFACEERRVAAELGAVGARSKDEQHRKAKRRQRQKAEGTHLHEAVLRSARRTRRRRGRLS